MPSLNDLCFYNRAFYNGEEEDWYSRHCLGCVCLLGQISFLGARSCSDVAALPLCGLGLWALEQGPCQVWDEAGTLQGGVREAELSGEEPTRNVFNSRSLEREEDDPRKRPKHFLKQWALDKCTGQHCKGEEEPLFPSTFRRACNEALPAKWKKGLLCWVLSVSKCVLGLCRA